MDLAIFVLLYIPVTIIGIIAYLIFVAIKVIKNPFVLIVLQYLIAAFMWGGEPVRVMGALWTIRDFTAYLIYEGKMLKALGIICITPAALLIFKRIMMRRGYAEFGYGILSFDRRYEISNRIKEDMRKIKELR